MASWTHWVSNDAVGLVLEVGSEEGGHDAGGGAGQDCPVASKLVQFLEHLLLQGKVLWYTLLHVVIVNDNLVSLPEH